MSNPLAHLGEAIDRLMSEPISHTGLRAFCRTLDAFSPQELVEDLADPAWREETRDEVRWKVEDALDLLRDAPIGDAGTTHLASMIDYACKKLSGFDHALCRPGANAVEAAKTPPYQVYGG